jgi:hypothetical protein
VKSKPAGEQAKSGEDAKFEQTVHRLLETAPRLYEEMKRAAPKRDPQSSGKGSKS